MTKDVICEQEFEKFDENTENMLMKTTKLGPILTVGDFNAEIDEETRGLWRRNT